MAKIAKTAAVKAAPTVEPKFPKRQILQAVEFLGDRDVLDALLPDDFEGTKSEVRQIRDSFYRKVVG